MKKIIALMLIAAMLSGCTGSFELTKKVYSFHRTIENKWVDEIVFLVFCYIPVYVIAILGDTIIFNSIEFWTRENPIKSCKADSLTKVAMAGEYKAVMTYDPQSDTIKVDTLKGLMPVKSFVLARDEKGVMMKDLDGNVISRASKDAAGGVSLFDAKGKLARHFTPEAVQIAKERKLGAVMAKK